VRAAEERHGGENDPSARLLIELHPDQIAVIKRHLQPGPLELWDLLSGATSDPMSLPEVGVWLEGRRMSHSLVRGLWLLLRLYRRNEWTTVNELAAGSGISPSSVHRYLTTLLALGLVEQQHHSRRYRTRRRRTAAGSESAS
jgi:DNA-binding transcriptional ArsR family regulator